LPVPKVAAGARSEVGRGRSDEEAIHGRAHRTRSERGLDVFYAAVQTINGEPFTSSAMPAGDGTHALAVSKALQTAARASAGDTVTVVLEPDLEPRTVDVPAELQAAFADAQKAHAAFSALAYSHQKEYVSWIASAKRPATRERRIAQAIEMLTSGKTLSR
jgi:hypothetical protein